MNKIILIILMLVLLPTVMALQTLGTKEQGECIELLQVCDNCTFVNISSVDYPNSSIALSMQEMTKVGTRYNYTFCNTSTIGTYIVNTFGDADGITTTSSYNFIITPTGFSTEISKVILIGITTLVLLFLILIFIYASILSREITGLKIFWWSMSIIFIVVLLGYILNVNQNFLGEYVNFNTSITNIFVLLVILSSVGGLALIVWLIFSSLTMFSKIRGTYEPGLK